MTSAAKAWCDANDTDTNDNDGWEECGSDGESVDDVRAAFYASCGSVEEYDERFEALFKVRAPKLRSCPVWVHALSDTGTRDCLAMLGCEQDCGTQNADSAMEEHKMYTAAAVLKGLRILKGAVTLRDIFCVGWRGAASSSGTGAKKADRVCERETHKIEVLRGIFNHPVHRPRFEKAVAEALALYADPFGSVRTAEECRRNEALTCEYVELHQLWTTLVVSPLPDRITP